MSKQTKVLIVAGASLVSLLFFGLMLVVGVKMLVPKAVAAVTANNEENQIKKWIEDHEGEPESVKDFKVVARVKGDGGNHFHHGELICHHENEVYIDATWRSKTPFGGWAVRRLVFVFQGGKLERQY